MSEDEKGPGPALPTTEALTPADPAELERWNRQVRQRMAEKSRRAFLALGAGVVAGGAGLRWLTSRREIDGVPWPLRKSLELNEQWAREYFSPERPARTFDPKEAVNAKVNGDIGLDDDVDAPAWRLEVAGLASTEGTARVDLPAIRALPKAEMTTEFKCIEGWSAVVRWAGARFVDFLAAYPPRTRTGRPYRASDPADLPPYVAMGTPNGDYYVGLDMESMLHPQTLLAYERNGQALSPEHGAPLRLVIPIKYGIKNIKRIGTLEYTHVRPADYWAERGYDWYVGL